jgi:hypothetical protein
MGAENRSEMQIRVNGLGIKYLRRQMGEGRFCQREQEVIEHKMKREGKGVKRKGRTERLGEGNRR